MRRSAPVVLRLLCTATALLHSPVASADTGADAGSQTTGTCELPRSEPASADASERARALFMRGVELMEVSAWSQAEVCFTRSLALVARATTVFNLALTRLRLGQAPEAFEVLESLQSLQGADRLPTADVSALRARARARLAIVQLDVTPADALVEVDGRVPVRSRRGELLLSPGSHVVRIRAPEHVTRELQLELDAGKSYARAAALSRKPSVATPNTPEAGPVRPQRVLPGAGERPSPDDLGARPWGIYGLATAGGALLASALITGVVAARADEKVLDRCDHFPCPADLRPELEPLRRRARDYALATDVLLVAAGATLTGALVWELARPHPNTSAPSVVIQLGAPGQATVWIDGTF